MRKQACERIRNGASCIHLESGGNGDLSKPVWWLECFPACYAAHFEWISSSPKYDLVLGSRYSAVLKWMKYGFHRIYVWPGNKLILSSS